jgi:hypothetical protein
MANPRRPFRYSTKLAVATRSKPLFFALSAPRQAAQSSGATTHAIGEI